MMPTRSIRLANGRGDQWWAPSGTGGTGAVVGTRGTAPEVNAPPSPVVTRPYRHNHPQLEERLEDPWRTLTPRGQVRVSLNRASRPVPDGVQGAVTSGSDRDSHEPERTFGPTRPVGSPVPSSMWR
jgi:hypothetical protein